MLAADDVEEEIKAASTSRAPRRTAQERAACPRREDEGDRGPVRGLSKEREALLPRIPREQLKLYEAIFQKKAARPCRRSPGIFAPLPHARSDPRCSMSCGTGRKSSSARPAAGSSTDGQARAVKPGPQAEE